MAVYDLNASGRPLLEATTTSLPTSPGVPIGVTFRLLELRIDNPTGGAITVQVSDNQGSAVWVIAPLSLAANGGYVSDTYRRGRLCVGGITWQASAPGCHAVIQGVQA